MKIKILILMLFLSGSLYSQDFGERTFNKYFYYWSHACIWWGIDLQGNTSKNICGMIINVAFIKTTETTGESTKSLSRQFNHFFSRTNTKEFSHQQILIWLFQTKHTEVLEVETAEQCLSILLVTNWGWLQHQKII